jgi:3' terminal RNA ribose 2'-O-methyltransferase Hen1
MLITISTTHQPATDLGYLLFKHPDRVHSSELGFGTATVIYPEANNERCTAALLVDVDPIGLIRGQGSRNGAQMAVTLGQYVNDRPYAASSFLSTAIAKVFGTAMTGRSKERPELAESPIPLEITIPALPCRGGESVLRRIFEPLGYRVSAMPIELDETVPNWGTSRYFNVTFMATLVLRDALEHFHVLIPVLDDAKHYWVGEDEIERLIRRGGAWLAAHPEREMISTRALRHNKRLASEALTRLASLDSGGADVDIDAHDERADSQEQVVEERISLNEQRLSAVTNAVRRCGARRVADLGCGEGRLVDRLLKELPNVEKVIGVDVSIRVLQRASRRLHLDTMAPGKRKRVEILQGALTYRDKRVLGVDAVTLVEVIEHVDETRLDALHHVVFGQIAPHTVIVTTPNVEYNALFPTMKPGSMRHSDHRFEWTRAEFTTWADKVGSAFGYVHEMVPIGPLDETLGAPTQMAVFTRVAEGSL